MVKFKFQINKYYLLSRALSRATKKSFPFKEWVGLQDRLYKKSKQSYTLIVNVSQQINLCENIFIKPGGIDYFRKTYKLTQDLLEEGAASLEFKRLYEETREYLKRVKKEWDRNKEISLQLLSKITGLKLPLKRIKVLIVHPKIHTGINFPETNTICWGHEEKWENYSTVYLCHELLHILVYEKTKEPILMHGLIELAVDQELRIRLNKKGEYFEVHGHEFLQKLEKLILPFWKDFLKNKKEKDIFELKEKLLRNKKVQKLVQEIKNKRKKQKEK